MLSEEGQAKIAVSLFNAFMVYKATEEGSDRPANPRIDIPGYQTKPKEEPKPAPAVAEAPAESNQNNQSVLNNQNIPNTPTTPTPTVDTVPVPIAVAEVPAPEPKPTPTVALPAVPEPTSAPVAPSAPEPTPEPTPEPESEPVVAPAPEAAPAPTLTPPVNTAAEDARQYYTVQFLTSNTSYEEGNPALGGVQGVVRTHNGKFYVYSTGRFATFQEASDYSQHLKATTRFKDAWALLRKEPATQTTQNNPSNPSNQNNQNIQKNQTVYRIQFCTATREMKAGDPDLQGITDFRCAKSGNLYVYTTGNYATRAEANKALAELKKKTRFKDAYVFAIRNGARVNQ